MKRNSVLLGGILVCLILLSAHSATGLRFEFDSDKEIADWELGPECNGKSAGREAGVDRWRRSELGNLFR